MAERQCKLEAGGGGDSILKGYDPATDTWSFSFASEFWKAVEHAHSLGRRGAGCRVAIIDTGCDLSIPALRDRVDRVIRMSPPPLLPGNVDHGTAVALLIARVAPECRIDVYPIQRDDGTINASDVAFAVGEAARSDATVINLSLGAWQSVPDVRERILRASQDTLNAYRFGPEPMHSRTELLNEILPDPDCNLCQAASLAAGSGKLVFAAAGNDGTQIMCPARAENVVSVGFQQARRTIVEAADGGFEVAEALSPEAAQSTFWDIGLQEISGVLGTSFAAPLYAGVAALGISAAEISAYLSTIPVAQEASQRQRQLNLAVAQSGGLPEEMREEPEVIDLLFATAMKRLPHVHTGFEAKMRGHGPPVSDPKTCMACGIFASPLYVNYGLFQLQSQNTAAAIALLSAARELAPWSSDAAANLGCGMEVLGDLRGALRSYDAACELRPGFPVFEETRRRIVAALGVEPDGAKRQHSQKL